MTAPATVLVGDTATFAVEAGIAEAHENRHFFAVGWFHLWVGGHRYGIHQLDATTLGIPVSMAGEFLAKRGTHRAFFAAEPDAGAIADAVWMSGYVDLPDGAQFFGHSPDFFNHRAGFGWWDQVDGAFDDGSHVLHFDVGEKVRVIGFQTYETPRGWRPNRMSMGDVWLPADEFYGILGQWCEAMEAERNRLPLTAGAFRGNSISPP